MKYYKADTDEVADIYILHLALLVNYYTELTRMQISVLRKFARDVPKAVEERHF